jgi:site-specific DNA-methyltransferase (adenine-specific)
MKEFPDKYFDLAIVDPPYGIGGDSLHSNRRLNGAGKLKDRVINKLNTKWDNTPPTKDYFKELKRISTNQIIWGGNYFELGKTRCFIAWDKVQPWENFSQVELAYTTFDSPARLYKYDNRTNDKIHPTQKPIALYKWLLKNYAKPEFKIIDTHAGSCSSVIAFLDFGCQWIAFEIDKDYYQSASKRIENHKKLPKPFFSDPLLNELELNKQKGFFDK